jgi:hypothetical protein
MESVRRAATADRLLQFNMLLTITETGFLYILLYWHPLCNEFPGELKNLANLI